MMYLLDCQRNPGSAGRAAFVASAVHTSKRQVRSSLTKTRVNAARRHHASLCTQKQPFRRSLKQQFAKVIRHSKAHLQAVGVGPSPSSIHLSIHAFIQSMCWTGSAGPARYVQDCPSCSSSCSMQGLRSAASAAAALQTTLAQSYSKISGSPHSHDRVTT